MPMKTKGEKAGQAYQDDSGSFHNGPGLNSIKTGKERGRTQTASVASPSKLTTGTAEGRGGAQKGFTRKSDRYTHTRSNVVKTEVP